ncbi:MAG TPA: hypothetical protein VMX18_02645 [Candidatus Bipolaricaulota bacterium]|nr:hypothetical protein [Candidatus Bipolaricaulota bacterium]
MFWKKKSQKPSREELMKVISDLQKQIDRLKLVITKDGSANVIGDASAGVKKELISRPAPEKNSLEQVLEGVFDGQNMIGADGKEYDVPANYASKSKLVEGDILKLTISPTGAFIYKQIKPIERERLVGELELDDQSKQFYAVAEGKKWRLLTASVTYFKGEDGDEVVFLIPTEGGSRWAAVENIINK